LAGLSWVSALLWFIGIIAAQSILNDTLFGLVAPASLVALLDAAVNLAFVLFMGIFAVQQHPFMPHWAEAALADGSDDATTVEPSTAIDQILPLEPATATDRSYSRSALTSDDCDDILARLDATMRERRLWSQSTLTLRDLAEQTRVRPRYITQALNTRAGRNFYDYVNIWRVEAACQLLTGSAMSVSAICYDCGFNSRSTFYVAFKRTTGLTPTEYRERPRLGPTTDSVR